MTKLPEEVKIAINKAATACVATVDKNTVPNVIYVSYLKYQGDETVVIADNKLDKTRNNIENNHKLSFVVLDSDSKKSYQVKGSVKVYQEGQNYQSVVNWVHEKRPEITPKAALYVSVDEVYSGSKKIA